MEDSVDVTPHRCEMILRYSQVSIALEHPGFTHLVESSQFFIADTPGHRWNMIDVWCGDL